MTTTLTCENTYRQAYKPQKQEQITYPSWPSRSANDNGVLSSLSLISRDAPFCQKNCGHDVAAYCRNILSLFNCKVWLCTTFGHEDGCFNNREAFSYYQVFDLL